MKRVFLLLCMAISVGLVLGACANQNRSATTTSSTTRAINTGGGGSGGSGGGGGAVPIKSQP